MALTYAGAEHRLFAPLYGLHHGRNMALAFVTALAMGVDADTALDRHEVHAADRPSP